MAIHSKLETANELLRSAYGSAPLFENENSWKTLLRVLLGGAAGASKSPAIESVLEQPQFTSAAALAETTTGMLVEVLQPIPRGPQKASVLRSVANWWMTNFGADCSPDWSSSLETYRDSLRAIRGLGPATVDELLLFAGKLAVFPLDRGTIRVAVRHGWLDLPLEDGEAQDFFVRGLGQVEIDPLQFSVLINRVATEHCGREPDCEDCPLKSALPEGGPRNPESC